MTHSARKRASRRNGALGGRPRKANVLVARIQAIYAEIASKIPDTDPGDALLVIERMCRGPRDDRVFFIFPRPEGGYDF